MVIEKFKNQDGKAVYRKLRDSGRSLPDGLKFISSYVSADLGRCFQLMEADDITLFQRWIADWQDLVEFEVVPVVERNKLWITDIEILRLHYAETLKAWRQRFNANRERIRALYDERFCRMWEFYLAASEVAFRQQGHLVFQMQLAKTVDAVPLTRDYMLDREREHSAAAERAA